MTTRWLPENAIPNAPPIVICVCSGNAAAKCKAQRIGQFSLIEVQFLTRALRAKGGWFPPGDMEGAVDDDVLKVCYWNAYACVYVSSFGQCTVEWFSNCCVLFMLVCICLRQLCTLKRGEPVSNVSGGIFDLKGSGADILMWA